MHLDFDAFYASVEQRDNPSLRGKPLIIGADPKSGSGRGVVVSCSYEARRMGARSGMPISLAYKLLPDAVYIQPNLPLYIDVSSDIMSILRNYGDKFEQASIDEAYLDVTKTSLKYEGPVQLARQIKNELQNTFSLTCSIGIAMNKSTAKIASDFQKPNGLTYVPDDQIKQFLSPLPVSKISGIGNKSERQLKQLGINTIGELAKFSPKQLHKEFGKNAVWLWAIANAEEQVEVDENYVMRSIGAEYTFPTDQNDWAVIDGELVALTESVHRRLVDSSLSFRTVTLKIRFTGFETYTRSQSLKYPSTSKNLVLENIRKLSSEFNGNGKNVRLVGVRLSGLGPKPESTIQSFTKP